MDQIADYLESRSEGFRQIYAGLARIVEGLFPKAETTFAYKMPGFKVKVRHVEIREWQETIDPNYLQVFLVERKNGITLHIWNPMDYYGLDKKRDELASAGFKVMQGCLQWNRKKPYPMETVERLLESIQRQVAA